MPAAIPPIPRVVELMLSKATASGWRHKITHGKGHVIRLKINPDNHKQYEHPIEVQSIALRLRSPHRGVVALYLAEWQPDETVAGHWVQRPATKRMGERSSWMAEKTTPAHWHWGYHVGYTWPLCNTGTCARPSEDHAADIPRGIDSTALGAMLARPLVDLRRPELATLAVAA